MLRPLSPYQAQTLFKHGTWVTHAPGDVLQTQGDTLTDVLLIADGKVLVELNGNVVDVFQACRFFGGTAYLMRDRKGREYKTEVTGRVAEPTRADQMARRHIA